MLIISLFFIWIDWEEEDDVFEIPPLPVVPGPEALVAPEAEVPAVQEAEAAVAQELEAQNDFDSLFVDVNILLFMHIAYFINDLFPLYVRLNWYGCTVDHPSQTQHSCIMEQTDTLLDIYLDDMLEDLKENRHDEIIHLWLTKVRENDELRYFYQD